MALIQKLIRGPITLVRKINELIDVANAFKKLTGDGLIKVKHTQGGASLQVDTKAIEARIAKASGRASIPIKWFKLTSVAADPMTGTEQTFNGSAWSNKTDGLSGISVYTYPQIDKTHYATNDIVAALQVNKLWVSLYNQPIQFDEC